MTLPIDLAACQSLWRRVLVEGILAARGRQIARSSNPGSAQAEASRDRSWIASRDFRDVAELAGFSGTALQAVILSKIDEPDLPRGFHAVLRPSNGRRPVAALSGPDAANRAGPPRQRAGRGVGGSV